MPRRQHTQQDRWQPEAKVHQPIKAGTACKWLHLALSDMLGVGHVLTTGLSMEGRAPDAEVMAITEAKVTFKGGPNG